MLKEMKYIKIQEQGRFEKNIPINERSHFAHKGQRHHKALTRSHINQLKKALQDDFQSYKNKRKYEQMQREIEYEQGR